MPTTTTVLALFKDRRDAQAALGALRSARLETAHARIVQGGQVRAPQFGRNALAGVVGGAIACGLVGVAIGIIAAGFMPGVPAWMPGEGFVVVIFGLAGAGTGAVAGLLISQSASDHDARYYEDEAAAGRTLLTVHLAQEGVPEARRILLEHGAFDAAPLEAPIEKAS